MTQEIAPKEIIPKETRIRVPVHFNGNILCAIDIETTGKIPGKNDIIQLCVLPVDGSLTPCKNIPMFHCLMQPKRPENIDEEATRITKGAVIQAMNHGLDPWSAVDRFSEWFYNKLAPPYKKKIVPLGHNFMNFDRLFILDWIGGPLSYDEFFRSDSRDTMHAALFLNDMADWRSERIPFPKWSLKGLCSRLGIPQPNAHDAVADCISTIECYKRLMSFSDLTK